MRTRLGTGREGVEQRRLSRGTRWWPPCQVPPQPRRFMAPLTPPPPAGAGAGAGVGASASMVRPAWYPNESGKPSRALAQEPEAQLSELGVSLDDAGGASNVGWCRQPRNSGAAAATERGGHRRARRGRLTRGRHGSNQRQQCRRDDRRLVRHGRRRQEGGRVYPHKCGTRARCLELCKPTNTKCEWLEACKRAEQRCKRGRGSRGGSRRTVRSQPLVLHGQGSTAAVRGCAYIHPSIVQGFC